MQFFVFWREESEIVYLCKGVIKVSKKDEIA